MSRRLVRLAAALAFGASATLAFAQSPSTMRIAGNFSANGKHVGGIERPFFDAFAKNAGMTLATNYNPMDVLGVQAADALRLLRSGAFDVMSVQIGMASRDDPFFEGVDLIGVATDMVALRKVVDAYREVFDKRLQEKFGAKVLTLWPFGPQVFYCNTAIKSLDDMKGLKVRSFTPSMAALIQHLGATPVTLPFSEVYPALQRGVANCGVTSPTSGNSGKWPEVTTLLPAALGVGLGAGPLHEPGLLEQVLPRRAGQDRGRIQAHGGPDVGPRQHRQWRRRQLQCRQGPLHGGHQVQDESRRGLDCGFGQGQGRRLGRGAADLEGELQPDRPQLHQDLERDGRKGRRPDDQLRSRN